LVRDSRFGGGGGLVAAISDFVVEMPQALDVCWNLLRLALRGLDSGIG